MQTIRPCLHACQTRAMPTLSCTSIGPRKAPLTDLDLWDCSAVSTPHAGMADGGLLCDLYGSIVFPWEPAKCVLYNTAACLSAAYCHEMAVRMVMACMDRIGARYKRYVVPRFCARIDFYVRLFVRVYTSSRDSKVASKISMVHQRADAMPSTCARLQPNSNPKISACLAAPCPTWGHAAPNAGVRLPSGAQSGISLF